MRTSGTLHGALSPGQAAQVLLARREGWWAWGLGMRLWLRKEVLHQLWPEGSAGAELSGPCLAHLPSCLALPSKWRDHFWFLDRP